MASWLRYITRADYHKAKRIAEEGSVDSIRESAREHCRREDLFSKVLIPASAFLSLAVACSLYVPGLWESRLVGGFTAIASMALPILIVLRAQQVQQRGRVIALAYFIREYMDEQKASTTISPADTA